MPFIGTVQKRQRHRDRRWSPGCLGWGDGMGMGGSWGVQVPFCVVKVLELHVCLHNFVIRLKTTSL